MSEYVSNGAPGAAGNGSALNGSGETFSAPTTLAAPSNEAAKTLWMGEMEGWMDENFIKNIYSSVLAENVQVKIIRDRNSGYVPRNDGLVTESAS